MIVVHHRIISFVIWYYTILKKKNTMIWGKNSPKISFIGTMEWKSFKHWLFYVVKVVHSERHVPPQVDTKISPNTLCMSAMSDQPAEFCHNSPCPGRQQWGCGESCPRPQIAESWERCQCNQACHSQPPLTVPVPERDRQQNITAAAVRQWSVWSQKRVKTPLTHKTTRSCLIYEVYFYRQTQFLPGCEHRAASVKLLCFSY